MTGRLGVRTCRRRPLARIASAARTRSDLSPRVGKGGNEAPAGPGAYDSSGDQAGSEAKLGVRTRCSLRPVTSMV